MNKIILTGLLLLASIMSKSQSGSTRTIFTKHFISKHPEWIISKDTMKIDTLIGFKGIQEPVRIKWIVATDPSGCLRIAYFKIESKNSNSNIKLNDIKTVTTLCTTKGNSKDKRRYESLVFSGNYSAFNGARGVTYKGKFGSVNGNGKYTITKFRELN